MSPAVLLAFLTAFVAGPALCAALLRLPARAPVLALMAAGVSASSLAALRWQAFGEQALIPLGLFWLGWVLAISMVAIAVRDRLIESGARRWTTVLALLSTTLPWFGLATARTMV
jgi:hypothetical protein